MSKIIDILERARKSEIEIKAQVEHIERLHRIAAKARESSAYSKRIIDKLYSFELELNSQIDRTVDAKQEALKYINHLKGEEHAIINRYYILGETWEDVALKTYMSERRVYLLCKSALNKLKSIELREDYING